MVDESDFLDADEVDSGADHLDVCRETTIDGRTFRVTARYVSGGRLMIEFDAGDEHGESRGGLRGEIAFSDLLPAVTAIRSLLGGVAVLLGEGKAGKSYDLHQLRRLYPNAYRSWTSEEEQRLGQRYKAGASIDELSHEFGRRPGGITARLERLGLVNGNRHRPDLDGAGDLDDVPW